MRSASSALATDAAPLATGSARDGPRRHLHLPRLRGELLITRLHCRSCGTALEGEFGVGRFGRLTREQLALLESFLRARGNLKEMERELGISYPTVRGRVDALVRALGLGDADETPADDDEDERRHRHAPDADSE